MKTTSLFSMLFAAALTLACGTASATNVLKRPISNPVASDNSKCTGTACNVIARLTVELKASADGTGATTPPADGNTAPTPTDPTPQGPTAADVAQAQRLVALLSYQARMEAWSAATGNGCGGPSSCEAVNEIGGYGQSKWGFQTINLRVTVSANTSANVCAAAAANGASCSNGNVSVTFNAGNPVSSNTPATLADTAQALYPGDTPPAY